MKISTIEIVLTNRESVRTKVLEHDALAKMTELKNYGEAFLVTDLGGKRVLIEPGHVSLVYELEVYDE